MGRPLTGIWSMLDSVNATEALGWSGFDWLLFDFVSVANDCAILFRNADAIGARFGAVAEANGPKR